jgi:hypothetical protein
MPVIAMVVAVAKQATVRMPVSTPASFPPRAEGDPAAKENESETGDRVNHVSEAAGERDARKPCHQPDN